MGLLTKPMVPMPASPAALPLIKGCCWHTSRVVVVAIGKMHEARAGLMQGVQTGLQGAGMMRRAQKRALLHTGRNAA